MAIIRNPRASIDVVADSKAKMFLITPEGYPLEIEELKYSIVRESFPIYTMGSTTPQHYFTNRNRMVTGDFVISRDVVMRIGKEPSDGTYGITLELPEDDGRVAFFKDVTIREGTYFVPGNMMHYYFESQFMQRKTRESLQTNRQAAAVVLQKEYMTWR